MCGICGELALDSRPVDGGAVQAMLRAMVHRGPDAEGLFEEPGIAAGIRRLAVIDVEGGGQPLANEDGSVQVVFNGEIYNFAELRDELTGKGHRFRTRSDTEVLVHLWEEHGAEMVGRLNGMFAFCIHDRRSRESFLARDRLGIKPLFYRRDGGRLVFASELSVLLSHPQIDGEVDLDSLVELYCLQYLAGESTVYRDVLELLPGHAMHVRDGAVRTYRYWEIPRAEAGGEPADLERSAGELRELLDSSVRYRRIADVPLGVFLSGGLDSSVITALAAAQDDQPVETFSVGFEQAEAFDEREEAAEVARHFGTRHHELPLSAVEIAEHLPALTEHLAAPVMDPAMIPTWLLSRFARERVTVALTGEGADELFGGYRRYAYQQRYGWVSRIPGARQAGDGPLRGLLPPRVGQALEAVTLDDPAINHLRWSATIGRATARRLFDAQTHAAFEARVGRRFSAYFDDGPVTLAGQLRADQHEWLPHNLLAKVDRASMAHSLEARVPFLDHRIVEWAARLPDDLKIRDGATKLILRESFAERLPRRTLERPKRGFDLPLAAWIRGPLRERATDLLTRERLGRWPALDGAGALEMLDEHLKERQDFGLPLFNLLSLMIFLDGRA